MDGNLPLKEMRKLSVGSTPIRPIGDNESSLVILR